MIYRVSEMSVAELRKMAREGRFPETRWNAARELKLRGVLA